MITTPQEYYSHLHLIQSNNKPVIGPLEAADKIYKIDLESRTIETPEFLSVEKDHSAETIYFEVPRFYDCIDLTNTTCVIQYVNAANEVKIYPVPFYDVSTFAEQQLMLIPWNISAGVTKRAGAVKYSIRFYRTELKEGSTTSNPQYKLVYNLNTLETTSKILYGLDAQDPAFGEYEVEASLYEGIMNEITRVREESKITWIDLYD